MIDNWKQAWKLKSVQVGALSAFFYALILFSEQFLNIWNIIPQELKNKIPEISDVIRGTKDSAKAAASEVGSSSVIVLSWVEKNLSRHPVGNGIFFIKVI